MVRRPLPETTVTSGLTTPPCAEGCSEGGASMVVVVVLVVLVVVAWVKGEIPTFDTTWDAPNLGGVSPALEMSLILAVMGEGK